MHAGLRILAVTGSNPVGETPSGGMGEWQTRRSQKPFPERECRFKSDYRY
jgi:hypothetical protein